MKIISARVSVLDKEDVLSIVILPTVEKKKLLGLLLWLIAWSVCGLIVLINFFMLNNRDAKLFLFVYLAFWLYFEIKIASAFRWKKFGKEKIWLKNNRMFYRKEISGKGKTNEFEIDMVNDVKMIELHQSSFSDAINQSFWIKGGERIQFQYLAKTIRMGLQLNDKETYDIIREIKLYLKKQESLRHEDSSKQ